MKTKISIAFFAFLTLCIPSVVSSAEYKTAEKEVITADTTIEDNIYYTAQDLQLKGTVAGDVFGLAETLGISGTSTQDTFGLAREIDLTGNYGEDVRIAAVRLYVSGDIAGELIAGGTTVKLDDPSYVSGETIVFGEQVAIEGNIDDDLEVYASREVSIDGKISGDVKVYSPKLTLEKNAQIKQNLNYQAYNKANIHESSTIQGSVKFSKIGGEQSDSFLQRTITDIKQTFNYNWLYSLLLQLITVLILFSLFKDKVKQFSFQAIDNLGSDSMWGLLVFLTAPIIITTLAISWIGFWFSILLGLMYLILLVLANFAASYLVGQIAGLLYTKDSGYSLTYNSVTIGVVLLAVIRQIPYIGWVIYLLLGASALGFLSKHLYYYLKNSINSNNE